MSRAGTIRILLLLSMCCACLYSQTLVSVMITPESGTSTANLFGKGKVGIWDCSLCNDSLVTVTIQPERVYMAISTYIPRLLKHKQLLRQQLCLLNQELDVCR